MTESLVCSLSVFRRALLAVIATVALLGLVAEILRVTGQSPEYDEFYALLSLSFESNLPTWFSSALLSTAGILLLALAQTARHTQSGQVTRWTALGAIFFYISLDETVGLHERANEWIDGSGALYFSWIVPGAIAVALVGVYMWPLLASLHRKTRVRFMVAGGIYVTGALLFEIPLGIWTERAGDENLVYSLVDWCEETLEMLGVGLFCIALVAQLGGGPGRPPGDRLTLAPRHDDRPGSDYT